MPLAETNQAAVDAERNLQAYYLAMYDRIFPPGYLVSIKSPGPGYELFQAFAKAAERLSLAVAHTKVAGLILTAAGGQQAQATVSFTRPAPGTNAVTLKAGTIVRASKGQRDFVLMADVVFNAGNVGPRVGTVQAIANGYEWNIPGPKAPGMNLLTWSEDFTKGAGDGSTGAWQGYYNIKPTITTGFVDPFGGTGAQRFTFPASGGGGGPGNAYSGIIGVIDPSFQLLQTITTSIWVRAPGGSAADIRLGRQDGSVVAIAPTSAWQRFVVTAAPDGSGQDNRLLELFTNATNGQVVDVFGAQAEIGSVATNYIKTTSRPVINLQGEIDTLYSPVMDPPFGDSTFVVTQITDATGGQDAVLDQIGLDRNLPRTSGESDAAYAARINSLPDTVSPGAFTRLLSTLLAPYGVTATLIELSSITLQTVWDAPANTIPANANYSPTLFAYDDTRTTNPIGGAPAFFDRWLPGRVGGIAVIPQLLVRDQGMAFDDTANTVASFAKRAVGAWDVTSALISSELQGAYDGADYGAAAVYLSIYNSLQAIKAAGVPINVELAGQ